MRYLNGSWKVNLNLYSIHDSKAVYYSAPFTARSHGEAIRMFSDTANSPDSNIGRHPADFTLFYIGGFDVQLGQLHASDAHMNLGKALDFVVAPDAHSLFKE